jgi:hypothetical protein
VQAETERHEELDALLPSVIGPSTVRNEYHVVVV